MLRYRLRTLLVLLAILPPFLWFGWTKYEAWQAEQVRQAERQALMREVNRRIRLAREEFQAAVPQTVDPPAELQADQPQQPE